jgi:hypothetical protein
MKTYLEKRAKAKAIQFTGDNREKIMDALNLSKEQCEAWFNEDTKECYLYLETPDITLGRLVAKQWVVVTKYNEKDQYQIMSDHIFKATYEELG